MKELLILRHAKSSWSNSYLSDHERPLNKRGKEDAPKMGRLLKREEMVPELIISSTAERALSTAEQVALAADFEGELRTTRQFYLADPEDYIELLSQVDDTVSRVMVVGHNPGMEELVADLTDVDDRLTTANIVVVQLPITTWAEISDMPTGKLLHWWRPKEIVE